jgi:hypothetical protein
MNGRAIVSFLFGLLIVGILVGVGAGIYQAGVAQGVVDAGRLPAGAVVPVAGYGYGYGWGFHGFGFLGLLFPILFLFLIFGLLRAAFGRGRHWGPGWGGRGYWGKGYGPGFGGPGSGDPEAWREERERQISDLHRRLHEEEGKTGSSESSGTAR